jgi:hypothetical protein
MWDGYPRLLPSSDESELKQLDAATAAGKQGDGGDHRTFWQSCADHGAPLMLMPMIASSIIPGARTGSGSASRAIAFQKGITSSASGTSTVIHTPSTRIGDSRS